MASGCGSSATAPPLFASLDLPVTLTEFRIRVNDFAELFVAVIEEGAERVIDESPDQQVRRNAMEWRLRAVNVLLNALNQPEPAAALVDVWVFCVQLDQFVQPGGAGADLFGDEQDILRAVTSMLAAEVEQVVIAVAQADPADGRAAVEDWVAANPLTGPLMVRTSSTVVLADQLESQETGLFASLSRVQTGVDDITAQFRRYISIMPRTLRWQTQLILHEMLYDEARVVGLLDNADLLTADLLALTALLDELPGAEDLDAELQAAFASLETILDEERARLLVEVDRQRTLTFAEVTTQREAIMRDVELQLAVVDAQIQGRLNEVFDRIETLTAETVAESFSESERLINLVYARVLIVLLVALAGGACLVLLHKWRHPLTRGKRAD